MAVNVTDQSYSFEFPLTQSPYLPSRLLGDDQICVDPVCQCVTYLPVGLPPHPGLCLPEPGVAHRTYSTSETAQRLKIVVYFPNQIIMCTCVGCCITV